MTSDDKLELLGRAFVFGELEELKKLLNDDCKYNSDYARKRFTSAEQILKNMKGVHEVVRNKKERDCSYTYETIGLETIMKDGIHLDDLHGESLFDVYEKGLLLYQYGDPAPVAVVIVKFSPVGKFSEINLSRNSKWFSIKFYGEDQLRDSDRDVPYTVRPMSQHDRLVKELQSAFTHQRKEYEELDDSEVYIWRQADKYFRQWLPNNGYYIQEVRIFDDCIGYRCNRKGYAYTVYMYAFGREETVQLDGEYCRKLLDYVFSEDSLVLVVYLNVKRFYEAGNYRYAVCSYTGNDNRGPELWRISNINEAWIFVYYPRKEMIDTVYRLMYAFNRDNMDVYDCIVCEHNPAFQGLDHPGSFMNQAFFNNLFRLHIKHGDMKLGFVSFDDIVYSTVPYIDSYGYFGFSVDGKTEKILEVTVYPLDGEDRKYAAFIKTDERESDDLYGYVPEVTEVSVFPPVETERFALKLSFDNGEFRKYVLPVKPDEEHDEAVFYRHHVFTDKIWKTARIEQSTDPGRGKVIMFSNEYDISVLKCYEEGESYSEPELCDEVVYECDSFEIRRVWKWNANSLYEDEETNLIRVLVSYGIMTFVTREGIRLCSINFDSAYTFHNGLAKIGKDGYGYGFIDKNMNIVIPMIYDRADNFDHGKAKVQRNGQWFFIDEKGREVLLLPGDPNSQYQDVGEYCEGMCRVSSLKLGFMDLAYHSDNSDIAGIWGYVNEDGIEVIPPQYIYAEDFCGGTAVVCKGKWTKDKKWDNKYNSGRYWTEEEKWGVIDKNGNEVIPFIFDEIVRFWDTEDVFQAHYGGREGGCGVIDNHGNWLADPVFEGIDYEYKDGLFAFYDEDKETTDDSLLGIYDIRQQKVIFDPQFLDVSFCDDGWIEVEVYDESLGRNVQKIIDRNGNEKFHSIYTSISSWRTPYEVLIRDNSGDRRGLIDEDGAVVLPCEYDVPFGGIFFAQRLVTFNKDGKQGVRDFEGNVILEPIYNEVYGIGDPLFTVRTGDKNYYREGLVSREGKLVVPDKYERISWCRDNYIICSRNGACEMLRYVPKSC